MAPPPSPIASRYSPCGARPLAGAGPPTPNSIWGGAMPGITPGAAGIIAAGTAAGIAAGIATGIAACIPPPNEAGTLPLSTALSRASIISMLASNRALSRASTNSFCCAVDLSMALRCASSCAKEGVVLGCTPVRGGAVECLCFISGSHRPQDTRQCGSYRGFCSI